MNLNMEDHRQEDFVAVKVKVKAFSGQGNMLGRYVIYVTRIVGVNL